MVNELLGLTESEEIGLQSIAENRKWSSRSVTCCGRALHTDSDQHVIYVDTASSAVYTFLCFPFC